MKRSQLFVLVAFACLLLATALSAAAVQAAPPPQGESGTARPYWLLLDPTHPVEATLPPLLAALAHLRARGDVLRFDQAPQDGVLRVIAGPGAAAQLRHLPGVAGLSDTPPRPRRPSPARPPRDRSVFWPAAQLPASSPPKGAVCP